MLRPENKKDKQRFRKFKDAELERGREERRATKIAAKTVKEQRRREGRSKEDPNRPAP
jgi:hypothetical protein